MSSDTSSSAMLRSASRGSRPSFRAQRRDSAQLNNNMLGDTEPMLPAAPVPSQLATDTHDPRWGEHTGKPNRVAQWRYVWREELAEVIGSAMIVSRGSVAMAGVRQRSQTSSVVERDQARGQGLSR